VHRETIEKSPPGAHFAAAQAAPCDELAVLAQPAQPEFNCRHKRAALAATILGSSMAFIDGSVVTIALPSIQSELGASVAAMQWVVNAYLLFLGALVLVGGSLGDQLGRRTIFIAGTLLFTLASAGCGFAPNPAVLIAARALQGIGAALLVPGSLAIIGAVFDEKERGRAIGTWAGAGAITSALGPVAGGWLVDTVSWRAIFFLNLPLALATIVLALAAVPESRRTDASGPLDWPGALAATLGLGSLTYGLTIASTQGFGSPGVLSLMGAGVLVLIAFIVLEIRSRDPMVPLDVFRSGDFAGANLVTLLLYFGVGGALFFLPYTLIRGHGYSATEAGAALLPIPIIIGLLSRFAGGLTGRYSARLLLSAGPLIAGGGFGLLGMPLAHGNYWSEFFPGLTVLGLGMTITIAPLTTTVMIAVPKERTGVASGINNAIARIASLLAVAILGIVFTWSYDATLTTRLSQLNIPQKVLPGGERLATPGPAIHTQNVDVAIAQNDAINAALRAVALVCAGCALAGAALAATTIGVRKSA
jgi:EmrB/QacA subfamily drug resistance transporter